MHKNESSPLIRLGFALQRIDERDQKALKFIQMGEKKNYNSKNKIKLPKLK